MTKFEQIMQFPKAKWILPFFSVHPEFCFKFVDLLSSIAGNTDFIKCVYGAPDCKMNNGCIPVEFSKKNPIEEIEEWNKRKISVWVTFSNYKATVKDVESDTIVVSILEKLEANNKQPGIQNGVIVASDLVRKYIKRFYPNLLVIGSVIIQTQTDSKYSKELYQEMEPDYDIICISHHHNNHYKEWPNDLINRDKYEIMLNTHCIYGCQFIKQCYNWMCDKALGVAKTEDDEANFLGCPIKKQITADFIDEKENYTVFDYSSIQFLLDNGFYNLKLSGRHLPLDAFKILIYGWMININYRDVIERTLEKN